MIKLENLIIGGIGATVLGAVSITAIVTSNKAERKELDEKKKKIDMNLEKYLEKKEEVRKEFEKIRKEREDIANEKAELEKLARDLAQNDNGSLISAIHKVNADLKEIKMFMDNADKNMRDLSNKVNEKTDVRVVNNIGN